MKFIKSTILTFFSNIFIFGISIITTILISRALGPDGRGTLGVANNIVAFALLMLGFGLEAANIFFVGKDRNNVGRIFSYNLLISFSALIIALMIFILSSIFHINILFKGLDLKTIYILILVIPVSLLKSGLINLLLGLQEVSAYNKVSILDRIVTFLFLLLFISIFKSSLSVILSGLISTILVLVILYFMVIRKYKIKFIYDKSIFFDMFRYGFKSQISNTIQMLNYRLDIFIINYYLPIAQVGIYTNAVALGETMWQVSGTVATIVYPMTASTKEHSELKDFINKVTRITLFVVGFCSIILIIISKPIILFLFGNAFIDSAAALVLLIPGIWLFSISKILANYIAGIGLVEKNIIASSISCIATFILDLLLVPRIGILGASIATSISYIIFTIVILIYYVKITESKLMDICLIKKDDVKIIYTWVRAKLLSIKAK